MATPDNLKRYLDIVLDPCNASANRRNTAAVREAMEEVVNYIVNVFDGEGDAVVPFKVATSNIGGSDCEVLAATRDGASWSFDVAKTAYDWTPTGRFGPNMVENHVGFGRIAPEVAEDAIEIIELEGLARIIEGTLNANLSGSTSAAVTQTYGAYPNSAMPTGSVNVLDRIGIMTGALANQKFGAIYDEQANTYIIFTPTLNPVGSGAGQAACVKYDGAGEESPNASCVWPGLLQDLDVDPCNGFNDGAAIWIYDGATTVTGQSRWMAINTGVSLNVSGDTRPVYVTKTGGTATSPPSGFYTNFTMIEIYNGGEECEESEEDDNCLFEAKLVTFTPSGTVSACDAFTSGADVYAIALNACACRGLRPKNGDRFLATRFAEDFGEMGSERDLYAFRIADPSATAVVEVGGSPGIDNCDDAETDSGSCYPGMIVDPTVTPCSGGFEDGNEISIIPVNNCDPAPLKKGERYVGICVAKGVYAVQGPPKGGDTFWGKCATNWSDGTPCASVTVYRTADCNGSSPAATTTLVYLPAPGYGKPNLQADNMIAYQKAADGTYVCVSDYMDDPIGTVKMATTTPVPQGWDWYAPLNDGKFPKGGDIGVVGATGGKKEYSTAEMAHHHRLRGSRSTPYFFGDSPDQVIINDVCMDEKDVFDNSGNCSGLWFPGGMTNEPEFSQIAFIIRIE